MTSKLEKRKQILSLLNTKLPNAVPELKFLEISEEVPDKKKIASHLTFSLYQTFINAPIECKVVTASSGPEALKHFEEKAFDVVINDLAMPGMNGLELLNTLKRKLKRCGRLSSQPMAPMKRKKKHMNWERIAI